MIKELQILDKKLAMDSREIAELTGKRHNNVVRDIRNMYNQLGVLKSEFTYKDCQNKDRPYFLLDYEDTILLLTGYSVQLRQAVIKRWLYLEKEYRKERAKAIDTRNMFTDELKERGYSKSNQYIQTTKQMKSKLSISGKKGSIPASEEKAIRTAESLAMLMFDDEYGYYEVNPVCVEAAEIINKAISKRKAVTA